MTWYGRDKEPNCLYWEARSRRAIPCGVCARCAAEPLSRHEIDQWLRLLGSSPVEQVMMLKLMLEHAGEDHMSAEDRTLCKVELARLEAAHA